MMKRIDPSTVQRILDAAEIVDVVSDFVSLKRRGSGYIGLCPFHNERTPSFSVSPSRGICKCFSCGKGGSPVNFIMELEKMSYQEALRYLAKKYNIEIQEREMTEKEREEETERESMNAINDWALRYFEQTMADTPDGRDIGRAYFMERGISELMMRKFRLGYSTESKNALYEAAIKQGFTEEYLLKTGLCARIDDGRVYDRFRGRVIYPVFSVSGKVVAFGGRTLRSDKKMAKYVNSPESIVYSKSRELYGLYQAKSAIAKADKVYLVEGYMDVISMYQSGVENVVASSGTSLTTGQIRLLRRFSKNVTVIYDSDAAGLKASLRGIDLLLAEGIDVKVLQFPEGDDPDSFAQSHTSEELNEYLASHEEDFIAFKTRVLLNDVAGDPMKRAAVITDICRSIAVIPELIKRTVYIGETSRSLGIDEQVIALQIAKMIADNAEKEAHEAQRAREYAKIEEPEPHDNNPAGNSDGDKMYPVPKSSTLTSKDPNPRAEFLQPFEEAVLRYVLKYGMSLLNFIDDSSAEPVSLTVMEYVVQEMELDGLEFTSDTVKATFEAARQYVTGAWSESERRFQDGLEKDLMALHESTIAELTSRPEGIENIESEEIKINAKLQSRRDEKTADFRKDFIQKHLISSPDDTVRQLTTKLVADRYELSSIHTRFGAMQTEYERLNELVERAVFEWKDAILDVAIMDINRRLNEICHNPNADMNAITDLMAEKNQLLQFKCEFAKVLGERIIAPRKI